MLKRNKKTLIITCIITLLPVLVGLLLWNRLPEEIATHFNASGEPDGWSSRAFAVFGLPLFILGCQLLSVFVTAADPKKKNIQDKVFRLILWVCPFCSLLGGAGIYSYALGLSVNMTDIAGIFSGVIFIVVGNYLPKCRQNYTVGIKLPWTLADEDNWNRTHRLAGWLWMAGGAVLVVGNFLWGMTMGLIMGTLAVMVLIPTAYSFLLYLKKKED